MVTGTVRQRVTQEHLFDLKSLSALNLIHKSTAELTLTVKNEQFKKTNMKKAKNFLAKTGLEPTT